ncbi:MAG TPA: SPOR domain-containing protein [Bryobacteraceae bacterium]|jgi:cell division septation protein DedD|nr:SPOR domain-containing protein [Bryobacteraceae bacterium]
MAEEKELVLGNKQLVSFFFVVLTLCGVFFALGYMIGRNSTKTAIAGLDGTPAAQTGEGQRAQTSETPRDAAPQDAGTAASAPLAAGTPDAAQNAATTPAAAPQTQPARDVPETPAPRPVAAVHETAREPGQLVVPEPGAMYLQVGALHRADAETLVKTLREQKYPALLATSSKPDFFRVLVGPYRQTSEVADAKSRLKTLGFADAFVLK